nr:hypothetical protein [uncultured Tyzzerella sp.]
MRRKSNNLAIDCGMEITKNIVDMRRKFTAVAYSDIIADEVKKEKDIKNFIDLYFKLKN